MPRNPRRPAPAHSASFVGGGLRIDNIPPGYRIDQNPETGEVIVTGPANESGESQLDPADIHIGPISRLSDLELAMGYTSEDLIDEMERRIESHRITLSRGLLRGGFNGTTITEPINYELGATYEVSSMSPSAVRHTLDAYSRLVTNSGLFREVASNSLLVPGTSLEEVPGGPGSLATANSNPVIQEEEFVEDPGLSRAIDASALFEITPASPAPVARPEKKKRVARSRVESRIETICEPGPFELNRVHQEDCIEAMRKLPDASVDIAIADPPYNASKGNNWGWDNSVNLPGFGGNWSKVMADWDDMPLADYFTFTLAWLAQLKRVVRPTGSIWIHGTYHNIGIINFALQMLSVEIINEVVWYKRNSFPNLSGRRLTASHETILWAHTGGEKKRRYYFNYAASKAMGSPEDLLKEAGKQMRTVWDVPNNKKREELACGKHPTQKPVRLLRRMLEISARPGDLLLVPFAGSGSDCVAAKGLGVNFIGFETDPEFVRMSNDRVSTLKPDTQLELGR